MKTLFACLFILCFAAPIFAVEEEVPLFKNVSYGMSKAAVREATGAVPCKDEVLEGQLCSKKPINFGKQSWEQLFRFANDKLISVVLSKKFDRKSMQNVIRTIENNGYNIILMHDGQKTFDKLEEWSKGPTHDADLEEMKFEKNATNANKFSYTLIENNGISKTVEKLNHLSRNILELLANAPRSLRAVEVSRVGKEFLLVKFSAPIARMKDDFKNQEDINDTF